MNSTNESEKSASGPEAPQPKTKRTPAKKSKPARKAARAKMTTSKPNTERANKMAEVIAVQIDGDRIVQTFGSEDTKALVLPYNLRLED